MSTRIYFSWLLADFESKASGLLQQLNAWVMYSLIWKGSCFVLLLTKTVKGTLQGENLPQVSWERFATQAGYKHTWVPPVVSPRLIPLSSSSSSKVTARFPPEMLLPCILFPGSPSRTAIEAACLSHPSLAFTTPSHCGRTYGTINAWPGELVVLLRGEAELPPSCTVPPRAEDPLWLWDCKCVLECRLKRN